MDLREAARVAVRTALGQRLPAYLDHPIFLVTCGRSGSTALSRGIGSHPRALMAREAVLVHDLGGVARAWLDGAGTRYFDNNVRIDGEDLRTRLRQLVWRSALGPGLGLSYRPGARGDHDSLRRAGEIERWGAKVFPDERQTAGLLWLFPEARFVYLFRDGLASVESMNRFGEWFTALEFEDRCRHWAERVERYDHLRTHPRALTVRFEDFVADDAATFDRIFAHVGLPSDPAAAAYTSSTVVHPLNEPSRAGDPRSALERRPPPWEDWDHDRRRTFTRICGEAMAHLGYPVPF